MARYTSVSAKRRKPNPAERRRDLCDAAIELLAAVPWGLGWLIFGAREFLNTDVMLAGILVIGIVGLALRFTRLGKELRALSDNMALAEVSGIDLDSEAALADRADTFFAIHTFTVKVSIWAWLDRLDVQELTEILTDSWLARRGVRHRGH